MSAQTVSFEYANGHVGAVSLEVAEKMEAKKQGKIIKVKPEPVKAREEK